MWSAPALELVCFLGQQPQVSDAVVRGARTEDIPAASRTTDCSRDIDKCWRGEERGMARCAAAIWRSRGADPVAAVMAASNQPQHSRDSCKQGNTEQTLVPEGEAGERRVAAGAAAGDAQALRIDLALLGQVLRRVAAVVHIHYAPSGQGRTPPSREHVKSFGVMTGYQLILLETL